jgi:hypothetical protein
MIRRDSLVVSIHLINEQTGAPCNAVRRFRFSQRKRNSFSISIVYIRGIRANGLIVL